MASKPRPRIELRLSEEDQAELQRRANQAKMPLATYGREMLLGALGQEAKRHEELVARTIALEESVVELKLVFEDAIGLMTRLAMAAVASSAMLKDDGKATDQVANKQILDHIAEAIKVSPGLLRYHAQRSSEA